MFMLDNLHLGFNSYGRFSRANTGFQERGGGEIFRNLHPTEVSFKGGGISSTQNLNEGS